MDDLYVKWKTMWDAKEYTTQLFFLANIIIALIIMAKPFTGDNESTTIAKRGIMFGLGIGYLILVLVAYFQLVPTVSPYQ